MSVASKWDSNQDTILIDDTLNIDEVQPDVKSSIRTSVRFIDEESSNNSEEESSVEELSESSSIDELDELEELEEVDEIKEVIESKNEYKLKRKYLSVEYLLMILHHLYGKDIVVPDDTDEYFSALLFTYSYFNTDVDDVIKVIDKYFNKGKLPNMKDVTKNVRHHLLSSFTKLVLNIYNAARSDGKFTYINGTRRMSNTSSAKVMMKMKEKYGYYPNICELYDFMIYRYFSNEGICVKDLDDWKVVSDKLDNKVRSKVEDWLCKDEHRLFNSVMFLTLLDSRCKYECGIKDSSKVKEISTLEFVKNLITSYDESFGIRFTNKKLK